MNRTVAVLGCTGSIGENALDVISRLDGFSASLLCARRSWEKVREQIDQHAPRWVHITDEAARSALSESGLPDSVKLIDSQEELLEVLAGEGIDIVLSGIAGAAGLATSVATVRAGKRLALANKESIVMAGPLLTRMARKTGAEILPVDSEHSAIFQALGNRPAEEVQRIILTASGGPFRTRDRATFAAITPEEASTHPNWDMGVKITVDSATMFNKALEVIEARWLFDVDTDRIDVVVHPQSIIHSMVEFNDASVIAQLGPPDMRVPIQFALTYPEHLDGPAPRLNVAESFALEFEPPDLEAFPGLRLGFEAAHTGGTMGAVLNAANEIAVEQFLAGEISFPEVPSLVEDVMSCHELIADPTLEQILAADQWARTQTSAAVGS